MSSFDESNISLDSSRRSYNQQSLLNKKETWKQPKPTSVDKNKQQIEVTNETKNTQYYEMEKFNQPHEQNNEQNDEEEKIVQKTCYQKLKEKLKEKLKGEGGQKKLDLRSEMKKIQQKYLDLSAQRNSQNGKICFDFDRSKGRLRLRKFIRILFLFLIVFGLLAAIYYWFIKFGFVRGNQQFKHLDDISFEIQSCTLNILDYTLIKSESNDYNYLGIDNIPDKVPEGYVAFLNYIYPSSHLFNKVSSFEKIEENGQTTYKITNEMNNESCQATIFIYKNSQSNNFQIDCGSKYQCNIIIYSSLLKFTKLHIKGINVQMNAPELRSQDFFYESFKGNIEIPYFLFSNAVIITREGNIAVQSTQGIKLTTFQKDPFICLSSADTITQLNSGVPFDTNTFQNQFKQISSTCKQVHPYGALPLKDNLIEERCYKGEQQLNLNGQPYSILEAQNSYGNIYVNVISQKGSFPDEKLQNVILFNKIREGESSDKNVQSYINLSQISRKELVNATKSATNPKVYDPIFLYHFGPQFTRSDTHQQLQATYNPAYSYLRPQWLGTLTLTLMTTQLYEGSYTMAPGFCPYIPSISLQRMSIMQEFVKSFMLENSAPTALVVTNSWPKDIPIPPDDFESTEQLSGFRQATQNQQSQEQWLQISQTDLKEYTTFNLEINKNGTLRAALIVSFILATMIAILLVLLIVFKVNGAYQQVLYHIKSVGKYSTLEKNGKDEVDESNLEFEQRRQYRQYQIEIENIRELCKNQQCKLEKIENQDSTEQPRYSIKTIFEMFSILVSKSPPFSAFLDYTILSIIRAKVNSIHQFYDLLFIEKKLKDQTDIHNLQKDTISGKDLKQLYERFCYLNQYLEHKFDDEESINYLKTKGFKIQEDYDHKTQYFTRIKFKEAMEPIQENQDQNSLDLFFNSWCYLTHFEQDQIEVSIFENQYTEFCSQNHLATQQLNESQLKRDYGVESIYIPEKNLVRLNNDVQPVKKCLCRATKYFIDKQRVENNFKILLAKDMFIYDHFFYSEEIRQAKREIQTPRKWGLLDFCIVLAHILTMILLGSPLLCLNIFIEVQQSVFSQHQPQRLVDLDTLMYFPTAIIVKFYENNLLMKISLSMTGIFWIISFMDFIQYYMNMKFPEERYFRQYHSHARVLRKAITSLMWVFIIISILISLMYFSLVVIWLMLGAIINPNAFLPYATSAATFVTLVTKKSKEFRDIYLNGVKSIQDYLLNLAKEEFQELLQNMKIQETLVDIIPTQSIKQITAEASKLGLIDPHMSEEIQNNLEVMIRDPKAVSELGIELVNISKDPSSFAESITSKLEERAKQMISFQVNSLSIKFARSKQQEVEIKQQTLDLLWNILKNNKNEIINQFFLLAKTLSQILANGQENELKQIGFILPPIIDFIQEFVIPTQNIDQSTVDRLAKLIGGIISNSIINSLEKKYKVKEKNKGGIIQNSIINSEEKKDENNKISNQIPNIIYLITKMNLDNYHSNIKNILDHLSESEFFKEIPEIQQLQIFVDFFQIITLEIEDLNANSINKIMDLLIKVIQQINKTKDEKDKDNDIILLFNLLKLIFGNQEEYSEEYFSKMIKYILDLLRINIQEYELEMYSIIITLLIRFLKGQLSTIPYEKIKQLYKKKELAKTQSNQTGLLSTISHEQITDLQNMNIERYLSLINNILNETQISMDNFLKMSKQFQIGFDSKELNSILNMKFLSFSGTQKIDHKLNDSSLLNHISSVMKLNPVILIGLIEIIMGSCESKEINNFINFTCKLNKINEQKIPLIYHLFNIYTSVDPIQIFQALQYIKATENIKGTITIRDLVKYILHKRGKLELCFVEKINKIVFPEEKDKASPKVENQPPPKKIPQIWEILFEIKYESSFSLQPQKLTQDINCLSSHLRVIFDHQEIIFIKKLFHLRNIPKLQDSSLTPNFKLSIENVSEIIKISPASLFALINLFTSNSAEKLVSAIQFFKFPELYPTLKIKNLNNYIKQVANIFQKKVKFPQIIEEIFGSKDNKIWICFINMILNIQNGISYSDYYNIISLIKDKSEELFQSIDLRFGILQYANFENSNKENEIKQTENINKGLMKIKQLMTVDDERLRLEIFLQYLIDEGKNNILLMSSFIVYYSGKSDKIQLKIKDDTNKQKLVSVEGLIQDLLQIKQEFFESIHTCYQSNLMSCALTFVKFFRQLQYLELNRINEPRNNFLVTEKVLEQYLRLVSIEQVNNQFFATQTKLPIEFIEFNSCIQQIIFSDSSDSRKKQYQQLKNNVTISKFLRALSVNPQELIVLLMIMYQDFDPQDLKWISSSLKLPQNFSIQGLQYFISIEFDLVGGNSNSKILNLEQKIKSNSFIRKLNQNVDQVCLAYILAKGEFQLLLEFKNKQKTKFNLIDFDLLCGITGLLSWKYNKGNPMNFFKQLFFKFSYASESEESLLGGDIEIESTLQFAVYKFTEMTQISPIWTLLIMGDYWTWKKLAEKHLQQNNSSTSINPLRILIWVLYFRYQSQIKLSMQQFQKKNVESEILKIKEEELLRNKVEKTVECTGFPMEIIVLLFSLYSKEKKPIIESDSVIANKLQEIIEKQTYLCHLKRLMMFHYLIFFIKFSFLPLIILECAKKQILIKNRIIFQGASQNNTLIQSLEEDFSKCNQLFFSNPKNWKQSKKMSTKSQLFLLSTIAQLRNFRNKKVDSLNKGDSPSYFVNNSLQFGLDQLQKYYFLKTDEIEEYSDLIDLSIGLSSKEKINSNLGNQQEFKQNREEYQEIFLGNYSSLKQNQEFKNINLDFLIGFLQVMRSRNCNNQQLSQKKLFQAVSQCSPFFESNKKTLGEIVSLCIDHFEINFSTAIECLSLPQDQSLSYMNLCLGKKNELTKDLYIIMKKSGLNEQDQNVIQNSIQARFCDMSQNLKLLNFSKFNDKNNLKLKEAFNYYSEFLWSLSQKDIDQQSNNPYVINFIEFSNLSPIPNQAKEMAFQIFQKISEIIFPIEKNSNKDQIQTIPISTVVGQIINQDWSILFGDKNQNGRKYNRNILADIFGDIEDKLSELRLLYSLKSKNNLQNQEDRSITQPDKQLANQNTGISQGEQIIVLLTENKILEVLDILIKGNTFDSKILEPILAIKMFMNILGSNSNDSIIIQEKISKLIKGFKEIDKEKNYQQLIKNVIEDSKKMSQYQDFKTSSLNCLKLIRTLAEKSNEMPEGNLKKMFIFFKDFLKKVDESPFKNIFSQIYDLFDITSLIQSKTNIFSQFNCSELFLQLIQLISELETEVEPKIDKTIIIGIIQKIKDKFFINKNEYTNLLNLLETIFKNSIEKKDLFEGIKPKMIQMIFSIKQFSNLNLKNWIDNFEKIGDLLPKICEISNFSLQDVELQGLVIQIVEQTQINQTNSRLVDGKILNNIFGVINGEYEKLFEVMKQFQLIDESKIEQIKSIYNQVSQMSIFQSVSQKIKSNLDSQISEKMKEVVKKMKDGKISIQDVFIAVDNEGDSNGSISIAEYQSFARRLGIELSIHRVNEIFAQVKNGKNLVGAQDQKTNDLKLDCSEFEQAYNYLNEKKIGMTLEKLGISQTLLALALTWFIIMLLLLFSFIFLGISAFAVGGTFGSIINSIIPVVAALGGSAKQENLKDKLKEEEIQKATSLTRSILHSDKI